MCRAISLASNIRIVIQTKSGYLWWARDRQGSEMINLEPLFDDYWSSDKHEFTLPSQSLSPTSALVSHSEAQRILLSLEGITRIVGIWSYNSPQVPLFVSMRPPIPAS
jgi:hypothetical protein